MTTVGAASHYAAFIRLAKQRLEALQIPYETCDAICGFPARYTATLLCGNKQLSIFSFFTLCAALALIPTFEHSEEALAVLRNRGDWITVRRNGSRFRAKRTRGVIRFNNHVDFYRQIGRKGAIARHARASAIRAMKRKAAMARWGKNGHALPK